MGTADRSTGNSVLRSYFGLTISFCLFLGYQFVEILALFGAEFVALFGIAQGDDQADGVGNTANLPQLLVIQPAENAGA